MRYYEIIGGDAPPELEAIDEIIISKDGDAYRLLREGKWIDGRFKKNIRIDLDNYSGGLAQMHGHVLGRKGEELGIVNADGTGSHGTKMVLHPKDAAALTQQSFTIRPDRVVEWISLSSLGINVPQILLG